MTRDDVTGASPYRFYRAVAEELWVLCPRDPGHPCARHGVAGDHRVQILPAGAGVGQTHAPVAAESVLDKRTLGTGGREVSAIQLPGPSGRDATSPRPYENRSRATDG